MTDVQVEVDVIAHILPVRPLQKRAEAEGRLKVVQSSFPSFIAQPMSCGGKGDVIISISNTCKMKVHSFVCVHMFLQKLSRSGKTVKYDPDVHDGY